MEGRSGTGRLGKVYFYYVCRGKDCGLLVIAGEIEDAVIEHIGQLAGEGELLSNVVGETNRRLQRQLTGLAKQQRALQRQLDEVKRGASGLLDSWQSLEASQGREFVTERLGELAQRRQDLERGLRQVEAQQAASRQQVVSIEQVRSALVSIHDVYAALQPYERRELVQLVVHRVELGDRQMVLEIQARQPT